MTATSGGFSNLLTEGLFKVMFLAFKNHPDQFKEIVQMATSNKRDEQTLTVAGIQTLGTKSEGTSITYQDPAEGYTQTNTHITYGGGIRVTRELFDDDLYNVINRMGEALGRAMKQRMETSVADIYNNGFDNSFTGPDSLELFSSVHTLRQGGTDQNELTTPADLTDTSLKDAISQMGKTVDDGGLNIQLIPKTLLVPVDLQWTASTILDSQLQSGTANNDINTLRTNLELGYKVNNYLTDTDAWFLLTPDHSVTMWNRMSPKPEADDDFDTGDAKFKLTSRWSTGWADWRGVFGVEGA